MVKVILRNGIARLRKHKAAIRGVFAMPVMRNFYVSHQWLRELKRRGQGEIAGVYFRIADEETVWVGHYNQAHQQMTAAEAAAMMHAAAPAEGFEVIIPRRIEPKEIHPTRQLPQVVGCAITRDRTENVPVDARSASVASTARNGCVRSTNRMASSSRKVLHGICSCYRNARRRPGSHLRVDEMLACPMPWL